jgi:hypothetical protein
MVYIVVEVTIYEEALDPTVDKLNNYSKKPLLPRCTLPSPRAVGVSISGINARTHALSLSKSRSKRLDSAKH